MKPATIPATLDSLGAIAEYVMAAAASAGLDKQASYRLRLAVDEIATNIIVHGYANVGHQGALELRAEIDDRTLTIAIDDTGATYDPRQTPIPDLNLPLEQRPIGGLGLLKRAIERVVTRLDIENASIILRDEERDELYVAQVADENRVGHERRLRGVRFPATHGIAGWVVRKGHSLIVPDVDQDPRVYRGIGVHAGTKTRSLVCVPVRTQERIIGVLQAINKRQGVFTAEDVRRLEALADELAPALEQARVLQERYNLDVQQLLAEAERPASRAAPFDILIGESPRMQEVARLVEGVRHTTATVLLTGERGTGKDLIARVLHAQGPRARGPFITVNCAALPETRLEAELFGDERGAGPGATQRQPGCLELAAGGTLFLDEIDALSPALQASSCGCCKRSSSSASGGRRLWRLMPASSPRRVKTWSSSWTRGNSAATCTSASTSTPSPCRRCASAGRISARWPFISSRALDTRGTRRRWAALRRR
jgi:anti-sigma regulatory factor (Ser/Thr protein kinase)